MRYTITVFDAIEPSLNIIGRTGLAPQATLPKGIGTA
jgi:hypothetical protein